MKRTNSLMKGIFTLMLVVCGLWILKAEPPTAHNWANSVGIYFDDPRMCAELKTDNMLLLKLHVNLAVNDVTAYPQMRFRYYFMVNGVYVGNYMTSPVTNSMINTYLSPSGITYYRATFSIPFDCSAYCGTSGNSSGENQPGVFNFTLGHQLMMPDPVSPGTYLPYPIGAYSTVWPTSIFDVPSPSYTDPPQSETKLVCCSWISPLTNNNFQNVDNLSVESADGTSIPNALNKNEKNNGDNTYLEKEGVLTVSPNPFNNGIFVKFNLGEANFIKLDLLDCQGRLVHSTRIDSEIMPNQQTYLDLSPFPVGLYYLRSSTLEWTEVIKLIKN